MFSAQCKKPDCRNIHSDSAGFTLLEIIIAMAILSFGLLAIATMQTSSIKGNAQAISISEAITLAQDKVEELIGLDYDDADLGDTDGDGSGQDPDDNGIDEFTSDGSDTDFGLDKTVDGGGNVIADGSELNVDGTRYDIYWNVAVDEPIRNVKTIRVIVQWTERGTQKQAAVDFMRNDII